MSRRFKILYKVLFGTLLIGISLFCFSLAAYLIFKNEIIPGVAEKTQIIKIEEIRPEPRPEPLPEPKKTPEKMGVLWVDRKSSKYVLNLGSSDGIRIGDSLDIYDRNKNKAGRVKIVTLLNLISYAEPTEANQKLTDDYYNAVLIKTSQ